jgi:hypothetical protein
MRAAISLLNSSHEKSGPMLTHASNIASSVSGERFCTDIKIVAAAKAPSHPPASAAEKITALLLHLPNDRA